jgi:small subunit ribosomal protein S17
LERGKRKVRTGVVVSNKMDKTAVVLVERSFPHPFYNKIVRRSNKLKAHDATNQCQLGDKVEIMETKPISKDKRWRLVKILGKTKLHLHDLPKKSEKTAEEVKETVGAKEEQA